MAKMSDTAEIYNELGMQFIKIAPGLVGERFRTLGGLANAMANRVYNPWCFDGPRVVRSVALRVLSDRTRSAALGIENVTKPTLKDVIMLRRVASLEIAPMPTVEPPPVVEEPQPA